MTDRRVHVQPDRQAVAKSPSDLGVLELRGLRALRRAGSHGMLHMHLRKRMRPSHGTMLIINAIRKLERLELIEYDRTAGVQTRVQGSWRITPRGRALIDSLDLPPAA